METFRKNRTQPEALGHVYARRAFVFPRPESSATVVTSETSSCTHCIQLYSPRIRVDTLEFGNFE